MPLDPEKKPRDFLIVLMSAALRIFSDKPWSTEQYFDAAEKFINEAEQRYGKLNP